MAASGVGQAQGYSADKAMGAQAQKMPEYPAHAGVEQRLNQQLPMQSVFTDEIVRSGPLQQWFNGKPVVMAMIYYNCLMLCPQVVRGLTTGLKDTTLVPGKDYQVLNFSIDPKDKVQDAQKQKNAFLDAVGKPQMADDVHFLTSTQPGIMALSNATGFHFVMVPGPDGRMDQFAHSSVIMFATPDGRMSKYLSGCGVCSSRSAYGPVERIAEEDQ